VPPIKTLMLSLEYSSGVGGGVGTHVQELSKGLAMAGDSVILLSGTVGQPGHFVEGRRSVHLVAPDQHQQSGRSIVQGILDYNRTFASYARERILSSESSPDLIHCHNWITFPAAVEIARAAGIPVICTIHYLSHPIEPWWGQMPDPEIFSQERDHFRSGHDFIAVSQSIRSLMRDYYSVPERRVRVIYNAVDPELFLESSISKESLERLRTIVAPAKEKIVLFTGRFHPMKGIPALLQSAALVLQEEPDVRYLLAGQPDSKAFALEFRDLLQQNPILKQKITFLGTLSRRRVALLYSVADVALLPSVYDPCPYAAIEAMAAGVPLVASDGGGLAELVDHGVTGFTVPVRVHETGLRSVDAAELAQATLALLRDENLVRKMGKAARQKAAEAYSLEIMVRLTREAYQDTLDKFRASNGALAATIVGQAEALEASDPNPSSA
jgi:glycosyltransferase involved in cell wall biosynthesis